jgi:pyruvate,water dikinase
MSNFTAWFADLNRSSGPVAGGKGANLGEMTRAGIPVPPGFVVTTAAFLAALDAGGVRDELQKRFAAADVTQPAALAEAASAMRALVRRAGVPDEVRAAVVEAYSRLGADAAVAVRSSATSEDTGATSFAGMHETYTNVVGEAELLAAPGGLLGVGVRAAGARLSQRRGYATRSRRSPWSCSAWSTRRARG